MALRPLHPRSVLRRTLLLWAPAVLCCAQPAKPAARNPFAGNADAAEMGRAMFRLYCAPCHGLKATGGRGPDLTTRDHLGSDRDADLFRVISNGVPGSQMPAFGPDLSEEMIWRMVTFIESAARHEPAVPVPGNAASGEQLFWGKGACGGCHRIQNRGGNLGPDLTRIGRQRSVAYLRESIVSPSADLTPGYTTLKVVTRDGRTITGIEKNLDNFSAQLFDTSGNYQSFERSDVTSIAREQRSLMPEGYGQRLSGPELDDLIAYLVSLRGQP